MKVGCGVAWVSVGGLFQVGLRRGTCALCAAGVSAIRQLPCKEQLATCMSLCTRNPLTLWTPVEFHFTTGVSVHAWAATSYCCCCCFCCTVLQGPKMKAVVHRKAGELAKSTDTWPPPEAEGFASVMDCRTDADVAAALRAWTLYGSDEHRAGTGGTAGSAAEGAAVVAKRGAGLVGATLAAWRAHVAGRKEPAAATGIQAFFKPAAAVGTGKAGTAGAAAGKAPLVKPAAGGKGPQAAVPAAVAAGGGSSATKGMAAAGGAGLAAAGKRGAAAAGVAGHQEGGPQAKRAALNKGAAALGQTPAKAPAQQQGRIPPSGDSGQPSPGAKASVGHTGAAPGPAEGRKAGAASPPAHDSQRSKGTGSGTAAAGAPAKTPDTRCRGFGCRCRERPGQRRCGARRECRRRRGR